MKLVVLVEVDASQTLAETMQRSGFTLAPDGTAMQIKIPNSPSIPQRKTNVIFIENPDKSLQHLIDHYRQSPVPDVSNNGKTV